MGRRNITNVWANAGDTTPAPSAGKQDTGWIAEKPPFQNMNWLQNLYGEMLEHVEQYGISIWDTDTTYPQYGFALGSDGVLYQSKVSNSGNDPSGGGSPTQWEVFAPGGAITPALTSSYVANASFYSVAGTANALTLAPVDDHDTDTNEVPTAYIDGMKVRFKPTADNTGTVTLNVNSLGAKDLRDRDGTALTAGHIESGEYYEAIYGVSDGYFRLFAHPAEDFTVSKSINGYRIDPTGIIAQWGYVADLGTSPTTVTLPIAFPNANYGAHPTIVYTGGDKSDLNVNISSVELSSFDMEINGSASGIIPVYWTAIGY